MSVKFHDQSAEVKATIKQRIPLFLRFVIDDVEKTANPKTPKKTGDLRNLVHKQVLGPHGELQWRRDYAPKQELVQHKRYTTPGTGPHFARDAVKEVFGRSQVHARKAGL